MAKIANTTHTPTVRSYTTNRAGEQPSRPAPVASGAGLPWETFPAKPKYVAAHERIEVTFRFRAFHIGRARMVRGTLLGQVPGCSPHPENQRYRVLGSDGITYLPHLWNFDSATKEAVKAAIQGPRDESFARALHLLISRFETGQGRPDPEGAA